MNKRVGKDTGFENPEQNKSKFNDSFQSNSKPERRRTKTANSVKIVGTFISSGVANGRDIYEGPLEVFFT